MTFDCMSPEEYAAWLEASARVQYGGKRPCVDCPLEFHLAEKAAGRCSKVRDRTYTPEQLAVKRLEMRARRERLRGDSGYTSVSVGVSDQPNRLSTATAYLLLTPGGGRRAASRE